MFKMCKKDILRKLMLSWLPQGDWATTGETFSGLNLSWDVPKPFFDRGGKGCGIISV
jgi:hypothetical protein